jgi:hypothetical protein
LGGVCSAKAAATASTSAALLEAAVRRMQHASASVARQPPARSSCAFNVFVGGDLRDSPRITQPATLSLAEEKDFETSVRYHKMRSLFCGKLWPEKVDRRCLNCRQHLSGTEGSNPAPSSGQSVSRTNRAAAGREPRVSRGCAPLSWRRGRQRRAGLVNITPTSIISLSGPFPVPQCRLSGSPTVVATACHARSG